jgi:predicted RNase H-like HicB family nuclease
MATINSDGAAIRVGSKAYTPVIHETEEGVLGGDRRPGCVSQRKTLVELGASLREALEAVLSE